jgi:TRAP-type C4-dicarboxylate transport system permease small subunit
LHGRSCFLALGHTLHRGEHIRVGLVLEHLHGGAHRALEIWCHLAGVLLAALLAWFSVRLAWQSWRFNDISQGPDATPLWIPQIGMAVGTLVMLIAFVDELVVLLRGVDIASRGAAEEAVRVE